MFDLFLTALLVLLNGFFVAAEFAIVKVRASQIDLQAKEGLRTAILSKHIINHLDGYLAATQLGITLASLGLGWIGEPIVSRLIIAFMHKVGIQVSEATAHNIALPAAFVIITILHIVFGELAPKSIAIQYARKTTLFTSYPLRGFYLIFRPFIFLLNGIANLVLRLFGVRAVSENEIHSGEELQYIVKQGAESGAIEAEDYNIIRNAFSFSERMARQIMIPRMEVYSVNVQSFDDEALDDAIREGYSRMPCYDGLPDNIVGIVYLKDLLLKIRSGESIDLQSIMRQPLLISETRSIRSLLAEFQRSHQHMAVVINEFGGMEGIVTMEDILEELVGEIQDELDDESPVVKSNTDGSYIVSGTAQVHDINQHLPVQIEENAQYDTLAGIIIGEAGGLPAEGDVVHLPGYEATIVRKAANRIMQVRLVPKEVEGGEEGEE
jgi:CBS domain containing-hemolysin-like protein